MTAELYGDYLSSPSSHVMPYQVDPQDYLWARNAALELGAETGSIPSLEDVEANISPALSELLADQPDKLPLIIHVPISDDLSLPEMVRNYESAAHKYLAGMSVFATCSAPGWRELSCQQLNQGLMDVQVGFELPYDPGYGGLTADQQIKSVAAECTEIGANKISMKPISPSGLMVAALKQLAAARDTGVPADLTHTRTRFINNFQAYGREVQADEFINGEYGERRMREYSLAAVGSLRALYFTRLPVNHIDENLGIRRVLYTI